MVPSGHSIPIFDDPTRGGDQLRREFERNRCRDGLMNMDPLQEPPEVCAKFNFSIGASIYDGAQECGCDETGSYSHICEPIGGQCDCKPNVIGRRCDMCAPGTYGLGPEGCQRKCWLVTLYCMRVLACNIVLNASVIYNIVLCMSIAYHFLL